MMRSTLDASFDPFALHPFTSGGSLPVPNAPSKPISSTPTYPQHHSTQASTATGSTYTPGPARRSDPTTPPDGRVPPRPILSASQQVSAQAPAPLSVSSPVMPTPQPRKQQPGIFTQYKADGRRTPELCDIISPNSSIGSRWPSGGKGPSW